MQHRIHLNPIRMNFFVIYEYTHVSHQIATEITGCANRFARVQQLLHGNYNKCYHRETSKRV